MSPRRELNDIDIDRTVHEPARLLLLLHLSVVDVADYTWLQRQTGLTAGNLGAHLTKLETAEYVAVTKTFVSNRPRTEYTITDAGRAALHRYVSTMQTLLSLAQ